MPIRDLNDLLPKNIGYVRLYFTGEGDIITHGINYTSLFTNSPIGKGLVRTYVPDPDDSNNPENLPKKSILRGDGTWKSISTDDMPIYKTGGIYDDNTILTSKQVKEHIDQGFAANNAMRFKKVVFQESDIESPWEIGDTYRVGSSIICFNKQCEPGDLLVCEKSGSRGDNDKNSHWAVVQTNINGTVEATINNQPYKIYADVEDNSYKFSIVAPTTSGNEGDIVTMQGGQAVWESPLHMEVGTANKLTNSLTAGEGLRMSNDPYGGSYNGSESKTISLAPATDESLGGVIIDNRNDNKPTISINDGIIYLTRENVVNALGYEPTNPDTFDDALTLASKDKDGLVPKWETPLQGIIPDQTLILGVNGHNNDNASFGWIPLPSQAVRDIRVNGISIGNNIALNFSPGQEIFVKLDTNTNDNSYDISYGISWYNVSDNTWETDYEQ